MSYDTVRERITAAAARVGRLSGEVSLVVVTKGRSPETVMTVYERGQRDFGENRAQELTAKAAALPGDIRWHFVGALQTNKVRLVRPVVTLLHSLDRATLAAAWVKGPGLPPPVLIQVNLAQEWQKSGVTPDHVSELVETAIGLGIPVWGLMAIPPVPETAEASRPHFARLKAIAARLGEGHPGLTQISMGMTDDFEVAIEEGATIIRVGRAIFEETD
ncbi:MAG: YggS family pyridoxal phosphate-dependent enzyme [Actinobacteria bacterium]|nr:YggS family pyridoxal phosphate-dependent enzyme [Actinomycetota bacterium]